ncbi:hypothetical protein HN51_040131 [Arachis hypogaea]
METEELNINARKAFYQASLNNNNGGLSTLHTETCYFNLTTIFIFILCSGKSHYTQPLCLEIWSYVDSEQGRYPLHLASAEEHTKLVMKALVMVLIKMVTLLH